MLIYLYLFIDIDGLDEALLEMAYGGDKDDKYFEKFKKSVSLVPEQIIRYIIIFKKLRLLIYFLFSFNLVIIYNFIIFVNFYKTAMFNFFHK